MKLRKLLVTALVAIAAPASAEDFRLHIDLAGAAAECAVIGGIGMLYVNTTADLDTLYEKTNACGAAALLKGKNAYRIALSKHPDLRNEATDLYASWLAYINELKSPRSFGNPETIAARQFENAKFRVQAVLDAR